MLYRLFGEEQLKLLKGELEEYVERIRVLKDVELDWRPLPEEVETKKAYAVDGSRKSRRLSGLIAYSTSAFAYGSGPSKRLVYSNLLTANEDFEDELFRLQMSGLEARMCAIIGSLYRPELLFMDGTLSGALIRPPTFPRAENRYEELKEKIGEETIMALIGEHLDVLEEHHKELLNEAAGNEDISTVKDMPLVLSDGALFRGEFDREVRKGLHIIFNYVEYKFAHEKMLETVSPVYMAKTQYSRSLSRAEKLDVPDTVLIDGWIALHNAEETGYIISPTPKPTKAPSFTSRLMEAFPRHFPKLKEIYERGINYAYVRLAPGNPLYLLEFTGDIDKKLIGKVLYHSADVGYPVPLIRAHHGVKITEKLFSRELNALMNRLAEEWGLEYRLLKALFAYGRSPLG